MIGSFRAGRGRLRCRMDGDDARMLAALVDEVLMVLDQPGMSLPVLRATTADEPLPARSPDPVLNTLMPPMSSDPRDAESLRELTEDLLRQERAARLRRVAVALRGVALGGRGEVCVPCEHAWEWLAALNDLRWALAGVLGIRTARQALAVRARALPPLGAGGLRLGRAEGRSGSRLARARTAFAALTWWQGSLLGAVRRSRTRR